MSHFYNPPKEKPLWILNPDRDTLQLRLKTGDESSSLIATYELDRDTGTVRETRHVRKVQPPKAILDRVALWAESRSAIAQFRNLYRHYKTREVQPT